MQVSFVFTNQISGKLVPVEPVVRSKPEDTHTLKGNSVKSYKRQQTIPSAWSKSGPGSIGNKLTTSVKTPLHIGKPKEITHVALKPKPFVGNYLPQKRLLSGVVDDDDDFA